MNCIIHNFFFFRFFRPEYVIMRLSSAEHTGSFIQISALNSTCMCWYSVCVDTVRLGIFQNSQLTQRSKAQSSLASVMAFTYVFNCFLVTKATSDSKICCQATAGQTSALGIRAQQMNLLHCHFRAKEQAIPLFFWKCPLTKEKKSLSYFTMTDDHQMMTTKLQIHIQMLIYAHHALVPVSRSPPSVTAYRKRDMLNFMCS